jgi:pyruvate dehydrogenase E2 component (dihydrolipoyllysine-residue acetyltransferase)
MADLIEIKVPDIGDFEDVEIIEVLVAEGDHIDENQEVITVESDKAMMEIPATVSGVIKEMKVAVGDRVSEGTVIALMEAAESNTAGKSEVQTDEAKAEVKAAEPKADTAPAESKSAPAPAPAPAAVSKTPVAEPELVEPIPYAPDNKSGVRRAHASPSVRRFARELGVVLTSVTGTGPKGRIRKEDVQNYVKQVLTQPAASPAQSGSAIPPVPTVNFEQFGEVETEALSRIKKISGKHLHACWLNIPHVTQFDEADITELEAFRQENKQMAKDRGVNLTPLVFIMKAVVACLKAYPEFNASLSEDKESLILKNYYNIGVAVDTPNGLMVPVIKDVDKKGFLELAGELGEVSKRAREGTLSAKDMQGGTFSISSLGGIGGQFFTPIINAPEVAILGVSRHSMKPVWNGKEFEPRLMLPLSISYDHRVIDGAAGARFTVMLRQMLSDIRKVLL